VGGSGRRVKEKNLAPPPRDSNSDPSAVQPAASRYIDCATPPPYVTCNDATLVAINASRVETRRK
jgi:hypothetical protein